MSTLKVYDLRMEAPPPSNDWSKLTVQTYKNPIEQSLYPTVIAVAQLQDQEGHPIGFVGPLSADAKDPNGLECYAPTEDNGYKDSAYTSTQRHLYRRTKAWHDCIMRLEAAYNWSDSERAKPNGATLKEALGNTLLRLHNPEAFRPKVLIQDLFADTVLRMPQSAEGSLQVIRDAASSYTSLYLITRLMTSLGPVDAGTSYENMAELINQVCLLRKGEAKLHEQMTLPKCRSGASVCKYDSHKHEGDHDAFQASVEFLKSSNLDTAPDVGGFAGSTH